MTSTNLTEKECQIVAACLRAAADGPFFPDWEFHTLFGLTRKEVQAVASRYPNVDESNGDSTEHNDSWLAINNAFANLLGYPHRKEADWNLWIPASRDEVNRIFKKWRQEEVT